MALNDLDELLFQSPHPPPYLHFQLPCFCFYSIILDKPHTPLMFFQVPYLKMGITSHTNVRIKQGHKYV